MSWPNVNADAIAKLAEERAQRVKPPVEPVVSEDEEADLTAALRAHRDQCRLFEGVFDRLVAERTGTIPVCQKHTEHHYELDRQRSLEDSFRYHRDNPDLPPKVVWRFLPCQLCLREAQELKLQAELVRIGCPDVLKHATFDNWKPSTPTDAKSLQVVRDYADAPRGSLLLISPNRGNGKTHLAVAILRHNVARGRFVSHDAIIRGLRASYEFGGTEGYLRRFYSCPLLVIDELGVSPGGSDELPTIHAILDERYKRMLPTVITANMGGQGEFEPIVGQRVFDRFRESVFACVTLEGKSRRAEARSTYLQTALDRSRRSP